MTRLKYLLAGILFTLAISCTANNDELLESSNELLQFDRQWTDITTYQSTYDGLPGISVSLESAVTTSADIARMKPFIATNRSVLEELKFDHNFIDIPDELTGVKLALSEIYTQELMMFTSDNWKPYQNHLNAEDYSIKYGDTPAYGRTLAQQWVAENLLSPWLDVQLKRKRLYERWVVILEEHQVGATKLDSFRATINKTY